MKTDPVLLARLIDAARNHVMTPAEIEAQRLSWVRGMTATCEHGEMDFEQCVQCRPELKEQQG